MTIPNITGKESPTELAKIIQALIDQKSTIDLDNLSDTGEKKFSDIQDDVDTNTANITTINNELANKVEKSDLYDDNSLIKVNKLNSSEISGFSMPGSKIINLTLGGSSSTYTAPANGYVILNKLSTGSNQEIRLTNCTNNLRGYAIAPTSGASLDTMVPCAKGDQIYIYYSAWGSIEQFCFIYAKGNQ